jgi:predicted nucleic acid-binding protein
LNAPTGVLDANTLIGLAKGGVFGLLSTLYAALYLSPAIIEEVIGQGPGLAGGQDLAGALGVWITEVLPAAQTMQQPSPLLSPADREVLAVAHDRAVDHVLSADRHICREATARGLACLRATDLIVLMKRQGLLPEVRPLLDLMRQRGYGIDEVLYAETLLAAGE